MLNLLQKENRMKGIPDEALKQMLIQMTQTGQVGTPEHILVAGEMQARKNARQKAAMGQGNKTPVIQDLLAEAAVPPQPMMPQAPAEAGIAAIPAPSVEEEFATGGMVAFQAGGNPLIEALNQMTLQERTDYQRSGVLPSRFRAQLPSASVDYSRVDPTLVSGAATDPGVAGESLIQAQQRLGVVPPPFDTPPPPQGGLMQAGPPTGGLDTLARTKQLMGEGTGLYADLGREEDFMKARATERKEFGDVFKAQESAIKKSLDRIPGLEKQYDASILLKAADALGSTPGGLLRGLTAAGGAVAGDVMAKAEKLTSIQDKIDERQAMLASDRIKLARADNEKDRNEFSRRMEKREDALQRDRLAQAQIRGGLENTLLNVQSRERLGELQLEAAKLQKEGAREDKYITAAQDLAVKTVRDNMLMQNMPPAQKEAEISKLARQYYNQMVALREGKGATQTPDLASAAAAELARRGMK